MKDTLLNDNKPMDFLALPHVNADHHKFYLSSCESGTGIDLLDSNVCSRNSSSSSSQCSSSSSSSHNGVSTKDSSLHNNLFLTVLKRLHYLKLRRQKHGRYRSLSSSLHLFFKKSRNLSVNQFYKSSSDPELSITSIKTDKNPICKTALSDHQLQIINENTSKQFDKKDDYFSIEKPLLRDLRMSNHTVSEDNNTNTMNSLDLPTTLPTVLVTDTNSSITCLQNFSSCDIKAVSEFLLQF